MGVRQRSQNVADLTLDKSYDSSSSPSRRQTKSSLRTSPRSSPTAQQNRYAAIVSQYTISRHLVWTLCLCTCFSAMSVLTLPWIHPPNKSNDPLRLGHPFQRRLPPSHRIVFLDKSTQWTTTTIAYSSFQAELDSSADFIQDDWEPTQQQDCVPKAEWQVQSFPNCNSIHEISIPSHNDESMRILGQGWFRTTWQLDTARESVVLKTLRLERDFLSEYYELHRRDAVAMERLTGSPFVVNVHGYCGQSAINELANFPYGGIQNLEAFNRRMRGNDSSKVTSIKLRMATSIALGLSHIHAGGTGNSKDGVFMTHYDLNPRNIALFAGGKPKINDFNIAEFMHENEKTNETCSFPSRLHEPWWRAPEEMDTTHQAMVDEKVDVYALGNILYHTLTTHSSRGRQKKERMDQVRPLVAAGIRPVIPRTYTNSTHPGVQAMVQAIGMCWAKDPKDRASAAEVASVLYDALVNSLDSAGNSPDEPQVKNEESSSLQEDDEMPSNSVEDKKALGRNH